MQYDRAKRVYRIMKKVCMHILIPILVLALIGTGVFFAATGNHTPSDTPFTFAVQNGNAVLTGTQAEALSGAVVLPQQIEGYTVTGIADGAFKGCADVTAFFLPATITSIGNYAFAECASLQQAILPEGLLSIGAGAFWRCSSLVSVTVPITVTSIGSCAFYQCSALQSLIVPGVSTPVMSIFNVALDIGQSLAVGNPARTVLDPVVTTVYCYNGSLAYQQALQDAYSQVALLDDCTLTQYTVRYVDVDGQTVADEMTVSLQPAGIAVSVVAAVPQDEEIGYPSNPVKTVTLGESENIITFVYGDTFVVPTLAVREGSGAVIDWDNGYVYGLEEELSFDTLTSKYLEVQGDGHIICRKSVWLGTGTKIQLIREDTNTVEQELTLIIFGDLDGDSFITLEDTIPLKGLVSGVMPEAEHPDMVYAGDMDKDGIVTLDDRIFIMGIYSGVIEQFDQATRKIL